MNHRILLISAAAVLASTPLLGQSTCITPNCSFGGTPASCLNRAAPRTPTVQLGSGLTNIYVPSDPKIEPGSCVIWRRNNSNTHSSSGNGCEEDSFCSSPPLAGCEWDSANLSSTTTTSTCYYDPVLFPETTGDPFYCRQHATPTGGAMRGTLQVTSAIQLTVGKDLATSSVKLSWTGGGVPGDEDYKVERQSAGNPRFPVATTTTVSPDGGDFGTTFTDTGDLLVTGTPRYYLVRNKQSNEP